MNQHVILIITIIQLIAVPALAFLIRMLLGKTTSEQEKVISEAMRSATTKYLGIEMGGPSGAV